MVNRIIAASNTALTPHGSNPDLSSPADIRAYLDFQIMLSRVIAGRQTLASDNTPSASAAIPNSAPARSEADSGFPQFIAQRQLELSVRLNAEPRQVDRLTLMLLADAFSAGNRSAPTEPERVRYPLTLA